MTGGNKIDGITGLFEEQNEQGAAPLKIIIAEDELGIRRALKRHIESLNTVRPIEIREAEDGRQALRLFTMDGGADIIITDGQMPNKDGYELAEDIRAVQELSLYNKNPSIIMVSGLNDLGHIRKAEKAGVDHIYRKGNSEHLDAMIEFVISNAGGEKQALHVNQPERDGDAPSGQSGLDKI